MRRNQVSHLIKKRYVQSMGKQLLQKNMKERGRGFGKRKQKQ